MSYFGKARYGPNFKHFDYVNPDAPKGGSVQLAAFGSFDSFNRFTLIGTTPAALGELTYLTLMTPSADEVETFYPAIATGYSFNQDRTTMLFYLHPDAVFEDGMPITSHDIVFSFSAVQNHPNYKRLLLDVEKVEALEDKLVRFVFKHSKNKELPLLVATLPILAKHHWEERGFEKNALMRPISSGPYRIKKFKPGQYIIYERIKDWWAKDLPVFKGRWNFDEIRYDYYRDTHAFFEAFKAGIIDYHVENISQRWHVAYNFKAVRDGRIHRRLVKNNNPINMQAIIFNLRHPYFKKRAIRRAFNECYNFAWLNKTYFYDSYYRTASFFENTPLAATKLPSKKELEILAPYKKDLPEEVFTQFYAPPPGDKSGFIRKQIEKAYKLFQEAGWKIKDGVMFDDRGKAVVIEYLYYDKTSDRILIPFVNQLAQLGIVLRPHLVEVTELINRLERFDFQMTGSYFPATRIPGYEQKIIWGSKAAHQRGSWNLMGLENPAVDAIINQLIYAENEETMIHLGRALDRVLQWEQFIIPQWHLGAYRIAYWDRFGMPKIAPTYGVGFLDSWWIDAAKDKKLQGEAG